MNQENISKLEVAIQKMKDKQSRVYLLVQDTKGNATASVAYIYRLAMALHKSGYNTIILHEESEYFGVSTWLGQEYMDELPHQSINGQNLEVSPEDFIIIPELYGYVMSQISKLPCGKIVLSQSYDGILETLQPGETWAQLGFFKCITTSETQKDYITKLMRNVSIDVLEPYISDIYSKPTLPAKPIVSVLTRDQRDTINLVKSFYIKFPQYRWITFRDMRNLTEKQFADGLKDVCLSVWIDDISSYGTFPLESMKTGVPVLGLVPNVVPTWLNEGNGLWANNKVQIVDFVADYLQSWLEDNIDEKIYGEMDKTVSELSTKEKFDTEAVSLIEGYINTRLTSFEEQLSKLETIEE
jgi:hypothetical protein